MAIWEYYVIRRRADGRYLAESAESGGEPSACTTRETGFSILKRLGDLDWELAAANFQFVRDEAVLIGAVLKREKGEV